MLSSPRKRRKEKRGKRKEEKEAVRKSLKENCCLFQILQRYKFVI
jgi:hypothetical protein